AGTRRRADGLGDSQSPVSHGGVRPSWPVQRRTPALLPGLCHFSVVYPNLAKESILGGAFFGRRFGFRFRLSFGFGRFGFRRAAVLLGLLSALPVIVHVPASPLELDGGRGQQLLDLPAA